MAGVVGMGRVSGKTLDGWAHVVQSIEDILTTPKGTRVMRRDYGSRLPELVDRPMNDVLILDVYAETAEALEQEPRFRVTRISVTAAVAGHMVLGFVGVYVEDGREMTIAGVVV